MNWLSFMLGRKSAPTSADLARVIIRGGMSKSGVAVTRETAMHVSTVFACARVISEGCAQIPIKLVQKRGSDRAILADHPVARLFSDQPNDWMTSFELIEMMAMHLAMAGNAFALITRSSRGEVLELLPLQPGWVTVVQRPDWSLDYRLRLPGRGETAIPASGMWHVRGPSWAGYYGLDIVGLARDAIGLAIATEQFGSSLFSQGARPGGLLTTDKTLTAEQQEALRDAWTKAYEGPENAMRTAILSGGLTYSAMSMTSDEAQFMETRRYSVEEICRFMRILPIMIGHTGDKAATFASAEQMFNVHDKAHMGPWLARIEQSATRNLLSPQERENGLKLKFMANALMRSTAKDRAEYYARALGAGGSPAFMTQDEIRALEDLNPMGGAAAVLPPMINQPAPAN